ncbi:hypothetical protein [Anatilimnocola floriformis]|uniref:hypothetical protein n=1 Tax=Anatilimnocola floriformis TaxID=2948575 RepID=UPI0020C58E1F|nr:hypothetical protein [Anatilimnocola floriformis]
MSHNRTATAVIVGLASAASFPWLFSTAAHLALMIALVLFGSSHSHQAKEGKVGRTLKLTLATGTGDGTDSPEGGEEGGAPPGLANSAPPLLNAAPQLVPVVNETPEPPSVLSERINAIGNLPQPMETPSVDVTSFPVPSVIEANPSNSAAAPGTGSTPGDGIAGGNGRGQGRGSGVGNGSGNGGPASASIFGVTGRGMRFVYVFDRSASMSGYEGRPLAGAKRELLHSLKELDSIHRFQIIFYNDKPHIMNLDPDRPPQLLFGDEKGRNLAETFVGGIFADGGTRHMEALLLAIQLRPDVIFFLTDADEPKISAPDLRRIRERSRGISINAIEFGSGPSSGRYTFLQQLAAENNGQHVYVDVTSLPHP